MLKSLKQYLSLRRLLIKCDHEWFLCRTIGGNQTVGNITFKHGSRLLKWCGKCGETTSPTEQELKENPPIFQNNSNN